ncbi:MAG: DNA polymerase II large subunit [Thermoplasmata archaeon]
MPELKYSEDIGRYFEELENKAKQCYSIAEKARGKGYDPKTDVEIPMAEDLAVRCQELTGIENTADKIRELTDEHGNREEVALLIAKEVANRDGDKRKRLEDAIRIGLAVLTEGILVAPLEGIGDVKIRGDGTGEDYAEISFAGPIRSAGGTGQAMSVLIADVVRRELGIGAYKPTPSEIQRYKEEIPLYKKSKSLQYTPSAEEIEIIVKGCPVSISGEGTEKEEVSGNRNLPRVDTDRLRGGACLVIAEGMTLKAKKLKKHVDKLGIEGWEFLDEYINKYSSGKKDDDEESFKGVRPNFKYIKETIAGRPVFGHPSEKGGFRLRYGRSRTIGLAAIAVNPAAMYLTDEFMAIGTQVKTERPGKAGAVTPCDTIEGPTVLLKNGDVESVHTKERAVKLSSKVKEIIDLGEILIPFGEFLENNHKLVPGAYCHEWWVQEVDEEFYPEEIDADMAVKLSKERGYPLHPKFIYFWHYTNRESIDQLRGFISQKGTIEDGKLVLENDEEIKAVMEDAGIPHRKKNKKLYVGPYKPLLLTLGLNMEDLSLEGEGTSSDIWEYLSEISGVKIRNKGPTFVGARMARPEKAKERKMDPPVHGLFPVGEAGGSQRLVSKAVDKGIIEVTVSARRCTSCGKSGPLIRCSCGGRCEIIEEPNKIKIPMASIYQQARMTLGEGGNIKKIKGVKGMINKTKTPEGLEKGILRAKHSIYVFKDGTSRYDMTDLPITHFKPIEIGLSIQKARELGYDHDIHGEELTEGDQIVEIKPQDVIASTNSAEYLIRISNFIDDLLEKYYGMDRFYEAKLGEDLIGELVVGLAPHTSGGVLGRLIGFHKGRAGYAHPYFHAAKRRNCFSPDTNIWVNSHNEWELKSIGEIVEENLYEGKLNSDDFGSKYKEIDGMYVPSISEEGKEELRKVTHVSKHPAPEHNIKFKTRAGRTIILTPQHKMLKWDDTLKFCHASEIEKGDLIPAPKQIDIDEDNEWIIHQNNIFLDEVVEKNIVEKSSDYVYSLTVDDNHTLVANDLYVGQCDGDEDCIMLLMDGLLNFSEDFLPEKRGGKMDAPLVLTTRINPSEIDKEAHNVDTMWKYPLEFYERTMEYPNPKDLTDIMETVDNRLGTNEQYEGFGYTHETSDISQGPETSRYTRLKKMTDKMEAQVKVAQMIRAVDADDVVRRVISDHFIPDMIGNFNKFCVQTVRCTSCNKKYRRPPLSGGCTCGGNLTLTVHKGGVKKYLDHSLEMVRRFDLPVYLEQRVEQIASQIDSLFENDKISNPRLDEFC